MSYSAQQGQCLFQPFPITGNDLFVECTNILCNLFELKLFKAPDFFCLESMLTKQHLILFVIPYWVS